jgi:hypothetical protein
VKLSGSAVVTYICANNKRRTITLHDIQWTRVRGVGVLRGQQSINGRMVKRTIAGNEIVTNGIRFVATPRKKVTK